MTCHFIAMSWTNISIAGEEPRMDTNKEPQKNNFVKYLVLQESA